MGTCDLLVSSPPYGDNASTVPYGQHSFLPLQWIDLSDIDVCLLRDAREPLVDSTMGTCDLLVSSPPYGDNASTVPYGQHSFLPLQWIDLSDIDVCLRKDWLATTHEIDHRSLGGSRRLEPSDSATLREISPHFRSVLQVLNHEPDR